MVKSSGVSTVVYPKSPPGQICPGTFNVMPPYSPLTQARFWSMGQERVGVAVRVLDVTDFGIVPSGGAADKAFAG